MDKYPYLNFDLTVGRSGRQYFSQVIASPGGEAKHVFSRPFSNQDLELFYLRIGRPRAGVRRFDSPQMQAAKETGGKLFNTALGGDVFTAFQRSLDKAQTDKAGLRLRLRLEAPELNNLPWEFLYNERTNRFISLSVDTPVIRYLDLPYPPHIPSIQLPLNVLALISSPVDYPPLKVEEEFRKLDEALKPLIQRGIVRLERTETATLASLQNHLRSGQVHIFHFIGHGSFDEQAQDGELVFEDENGYSKKWSGQHLGLILNDHRWMRLALLNACEGARTGKTDPFAGAAQSLVQQGLPAVIAMQFEITDKAAIALSSEFYKSLAEGFPVDRALGEGRKAILASGNDIEWGNPVLFSRAADGLLFELVSLPTPIPAPAPQPLPKIIEQPEPEPQSAGPRPEPSPLPEPETRPAEPGPRPSPQPALQKIDRRVITGGIILVSLLALFLIFSNLWNRQDTLQGKLTPVPTITEAVAALQTTVPTLPSGTQAKPGSPTPTTYAAIPWNTIAPTHPGSTPQDQPKSLELVGQVGGKIKAIAAKDNLVVIGEGIRVVVLDVSDLQTPKVLSKSKLLPDVVQGLAISGDIVFVADGAGGLKILSIANPESPRELETAPGITGVNAVSVIQNTAFIGTESQLCSMDIQNPASPQPLAYIGADWKISGIELRGKYAYVGSPLGLMIYDVSNPAKPAQVGKYKNNLGSTSVDNIPFSLQGNLAIILGYDMEAIDISDPAKPAKVTLPVQISGADAVTSKGNLVYLAENGTGLRVIDFSTPGYPVELDTIPITRSISVLTTDGENIYYAISGGFCAGSIRDPQKPSQLGCYQSVAETRYLAADGGKLFTASYAGFHMINLADPANPLPGWFSSFPYAYQLTAGGSLLVTTISNGLAIFDISDPGHITEISTIEIYQPRTIYLSNRVLYVVSGKDLNVISLSDPKNPTTLSTLQLPDIITSACLSGNHLYLQEHAQIHVIDVSDPSGPIEMSVFQFKYELHAAVEGDQKVFLAANALHIFDISTLKSPQGVGYYETNPFASMIKDGNILYLVVIGGMDVIDIRDAIHPSLVEHITAPTTPWAAVDMGNFIVVSDGDAGVLVYKKK